MNKYALATAISLTYATMSWSSAPAVAQDNAELSPAEKIYAELATLSPEEREKRIIEGAEKEGSLVFVHTWRGELARDHVDIFQKRYPFLNVEFIDIGSQDAAERLSAEEAAGRHLTDAMSVSIGDTDHIRSLLAHYTTPALDKILPEYEGLKDPESLWVPFYFTEHGLSYNSSLLTPEQAPKDWWDLCKPEYKGMISFDPPELRFLLGMNEVIGSDRIEEWIKCIGANDPITQRGHTQRLQLMLAGDHAIQGDNYLYLGMSMKAENPDLPFQPVWTAPVHGAGGALLINKNTPHPYAAALLADWMLSEESQQYTSDKYRGPITMPNPYMPADAKVVVVGNGDPENNNRLLDMWEQYVSRGGQ